MTACMTITLRGSWSVGRRRVSGVRRSVPRKKKQQTRPTIFASQLFGERNEVCIICIVLLFNVFYVLTVTQGIETYFVVSVMQEVIQERKACRNVFEVMDFICIDYDVYLKNRLVSLACVRSSYRNSFGLKSRKVSAGIVEITRLGQSTFVLVQEEQGSDGDVFVEMKSGACSHCERTKFCVHVSTIACLYPESMVRQSMVQSLQYHEKYN